METKRVIEGQTRRGWLKLSGGR